LHAFLERGIKVQLRKISVDSSVRRRGGKLDVNVPG